VRRTVRLSDRHDEAVRIAAAATGTTISEVVREALEDWLGEKERIRRRPRPETFEEALDRSETALYDV
jgi:hypothetical protein